MPVWLRGYPDGWNVLQPCHVSKDDIAGDGAMLTAEQARKLFIYDCEQGVLINRVARGSRAVKGMISGWVCGRGYVRIMVNGDLYRVHNIIWLMSYGEWPKEIDHINGVTGDNRLSNLRNISSNENKKNKSLPKNNTSGVMGVFWNGIRGKWQSSIRVDGKRIHLKQAADKFEVICARKSAENRYGYHPNHGLTQEQRALT